MRTLTLLIALLVLALPTAGRAGDKAGVFDYYVLALSWNPAWCAAEGDARGAPQCEPRHGIGFVLHGLWPQFEDGWPQYCDWQGRGPTAAELAGMDALTRAPGLGAYQWKKHGRCSGLDPAAYFDLARRAWASIRRPEALRETSAMLRLDPERIEGSFLLENPGLAPEAVTVTCKRGLIREVRICLTRDLAPRPCTGPAARGCPDARADFLPMR